MEVNLHVPFRDIFNNEIVNEKGEIQYIDSTLCLGLFSGSFIQPSGDYQEDLTKKFNAFTACMKIHNAQGEVDLDDKEVEIVKQAAGMLSPGGYGQILNILDNKDQI